VFERHDDRLRRVVHIPENKLAMVIECPGREEAGRVCTNQLEPMPPLADLIVIDLDAGDMSERNLYLVPEGPELVHAFHGEDGAVAIDADINHKER
jgi:hypothetical protein